MATKAGVQVDGLRQVVRSLEKFGVQAADLKAAFKRIGTVVVNEAKSIAPSRSGRLANSIKPSNTKNKAVIRAGAAKVPYAGVIHYGGYNNIRPNPFLSKAAADKEAESIQLMEQELGDIIRALDLK